MSGTAGWAPPLILLHWMTGLLALAVAVLAAFLLSPPQWTQAYIDRYIALITWHRLGASLCCCWRSFGQGCAQARRDRLARATPPSKERLDWYTMRFSRY